jgi:hypothetical protein
MATIIIGTYMVRYPLGGNLSWALQYLLGLQALGHDVYAFEKFVHADSCYDPVAQTMTDNCTYGVHTVRALLARHGFAGKFCFVDASNRYHGLSPQQVGQVFLRADLYIENGAIGAWDEEAARTTRIFLDVDPAFTQIKFYNLARHGKPLPCFHGYYTNGWNVGRPGNELPTNGVHWRHFFNPVHVDWFRPAPPVPGAPYSTIMNWKSYDEPVVYNGVAYGHKDREFVHFEELPQRVAVPLEIAVSGLPESDRGRVEQHGWRLKDAQEVTFTVDSFRRYVDSCRGEFSVCKNMYVATNSGWFSDRSGAFMAAGRPVIIQDTGFGAHLPTGEGVFAVRDGGEAAAAIAAVEGDYERHSRRARELAREYLDAPKVLRRLLSDFNVQ